MTRIAIGAEHLYIKGRIETGEDRDMTYSYTVVPRKTIQEVYLESEGGTRFRVLLGEDSVAIRGIGRARRRDKLAYEPYKIPGREDLGTLYELPWVPQHNGILSEEKISQDGSTHLYVAKKSENYDKPDLGFIEVAADNEALYLTSDTDFSVYTPADEQLSA